MIFVTVGTHEQPFDRLVKYMDEWSRDHNEDVTMQVGYSTYEPKYCEWKKLYSYTEMVKLVGEARIIITHGGPSSFIMPLQIGKTPIVVPRSSKYGEHVNDHQVCFSRAVSVRMGTIIVIEDENELSNIIERYDEIVEGMGSKLNSNNKAFNEKLEKLVETMFK